MNDVLNQRSDDEVIIRCNCGSDHFVTFSRAIDGEEQWAWANVVAEYRPDRKSTRLNSSHIQKSRMPSSA